MTCIAWRLRMPGFLLLLDACSEGPVAKAGYRFFPRHCQTRFPLWPTCNPCFVRLHGTAATHEIDIPTTTSPLVTSDWRRFSPKRSASWRPVRFEPVGRGTT
jgi:hypothetical protein